MRSMLPTDVPPYFWTIRAMALAALRALASQRAEHDGRVGAAEAERVGHRGGDPHLPRLARHEIEVALRILLKQVRRRRRNLVADREHREHRFDARRGAQEVTRHRLGRRHGELACMVAERTLDGDA